MNRLWLLIPALSSAPAPAEVKSASPAGFEVETRAVASVAPAQAYAMIGRIGSWWDPAHSYSSDGANLSLEARAGGCFCEKIPATGGTVEHMRVVQAQPGAMLRLQGGLGPLQAEGATGSLTWQLKAVPGGTEIIQSYVVGGYIRMGAEKLAPLVDQVLSHQFSRLLKRLAEPRPNPSS